MDLLPVRRYGALWLLPWGGGGIEAVASVITQSIMGEVLDLERFVLGFGLGAVMGVLGAAGSKLGEVSKGRIRGK